MRRHQLHAGALAALGPHFEVDFHPSTASAPPEPWQRMARLLEVPAALAARVDAVRGALASGINQAPEDVDVQVAVSLTHLNLVGRLIAPALATDALGFPPLSLEPEGLWWQDTLGGPPPLSVVTTERSDLGGSFVEALTAAVADAFGVSKRVLWGNVGSAVNGAAGLVAGNRPDLANAARAAGNALLADHRIDGGTLACGPEFRRRTCCLLYRVTGTRTSICGDCGLAGGL